MTFPLMLTTAIAAEMSLIENSLYEGSAQGHD